MLSLIDGELAEKIMTAHRYINRANLYIKALEQHVDISGATTAISLARDAKTNSRKSIHEALRGLRAYLEKS